MAGDDQSAQSSSNTRAASASRGSRALPTGPRRSSSNKPADGQRAGSQPKQRVSTSGSSSSNASGGSKGRASSVGKVGSAPPTPTLGRTELAIERAKKMALGKTPEQLEYVLQDALQRGRFEDAAYLIAVTPVLASKYKTVDVVRLMIDMQHCDAAAQLMRDMKLQDNPLLVTLLVNELIRASRFQAAVRYAQEMVPNFGKAPIDGAANDQTRPSWTPQALVQAMIRAQQFRTALKYAKQFELLEMFPAAQLVASMLTTQAWDDAVSSILEFKLTAEFPLEPLAIKLLEHRQWSCALKCIQKLTTKELVDKYSEALVREAARVGDFVVALRYLREFKLDQPTTHGGLLRYFLDCLVHHQEFYKAIKYAIKFGLAEEDSETGETSVYATSVLIRRAIDCDQMHVASTYIKKLGLRDQFQPELEIIKHRQRGMLQEFRAFAQLRDAQYHHAMYQTQLALLLGDKAQDEFVDRASEVDVTIAEQEEIVPRKKKAPQPTAEEEQPQQLPTEPNASSEDATDRQSRFGFARQGEAVAPAAPVRVPGPPPGLASSPAQPEPPSSSFNFAQFAASLQPSAPVPTPNPTPSNGSSFGPSPASLDHLFPMNSRLPQAQPSLRSFAAPPGMLSSQLSQPPQRPHPSPSQGLDVSSLAMQFHGMPPPAAPAPRWSSASLPRATAPATSHLRRLRRFPSIRTPWRRRRSRTRCLRRRRRRSRRSSPA
ncbi:hypothetical protein PINS_up022496 [Pythium insidiosum]|nr:hypothetical protein PINS_up022496 [Pythium insidiosum]